MNEAYTLTSPLPASAVDTIYHARKGTAKNAVKAGRLRACIRKGRGGQQAWIMPEDARAWFYAGMPTEPEQQPIEPGNHRSASGN